MYRLKTEQIFNKVRVYFVEILSQTAKNKNIYDTTRKV